MESAFIDDAADPEINRQRLELMESGSDDQGNELPMPRPGVFFTQKQLDYHINLVDMLASCAEGENLFIESLCQTIFSIDELLQVFNDDKISVLHKRPYLRFFLWAYLNVEGSAIDSGMAEIIHNPELWRFFERLVKYLDQITKTIQGMRKGDSLPSADRDFLFLGVMPTLRIFFSDYFDKESLLQRGQVDTDAIGAEAIDIAQALVSVFEKLVPAAETGLDEPEQRQDINEVLLALSTKCQVSEAMRLKLEKKLNMTAGLKIDSQIVQDYKRMYKDEIEINKSLNEFALNVKAAYEGENTCIEQLGHAPSGAEDRDYSELGGDEELPIGKEFQNFVRTFADYHIVGGCLRLHSIKPVVRRVVDALRFSTHLKSTMTAKQIKRQEALDVKCFQVLRTIVHNEKMQLPSDEDDITSNRAVWKSIEMAQNTLNGYNVIIATMDGSLTSANSEVVREFMAMTVGLLDGGNKNVQASFESYFLNTREEAFFLEMSGRMRASLRHLQERRALFEQAQRLAEQKLEMLTTLMTQNSTIGGGDKETANVAKMAAGATDEIELQQLTGADDQPDAEQELKFTDHGNIELVLRTLQLLCEGYNDTLKDYLRTQPDNIKSINLVKETVEFLASLYTDIHGDNVELVIQCLDTIVEFTQGNQANQSDVYDAQVGNIKKAFNH